MRRRNSGKIPYSFPTMRPNSLHQSVIRIADHADEYVAVKRRLVLANRLQDQGWVDSALSCFEFADKAAYEALDFMSLTDEESVRSQYKAALIAANITCVVVDSDGVEIANF